MGAAAEAILIRTRRTLLFWGWNAGSRYDAMPMTSQSVACGRERSLQVLRSIVVSPTQAWHTQVGERP